MSLVSVWQRRLRRMQICFKMLNLIQCFTGIEAKSHLSTLNYHRDSEWFISDLSSEWVSFPCFIFCPALHIFAIPGIPRTIVSPLSIKYTTRLHSFYHSMLAHCSLTIQWSKSNAFSRQTPRKRNGAIPWGIRMNKFHICTISRTSHSNKTSIAMPFKIWLNF